MWLLSDQGQNDDEAKKRPHRVSFRERHPIVARPKGGGLLGVGYGRGNLQKGLAGPSEKRRIQTSGRSRCLRNSARPQPHGKPAVFEAEPTLQSETEVLFKAAAVVGQKESCL